MVVIEQRLFGISRNQITSGLFIAWQLTAALLSLSIYLLFRSENTLINVLFEQLFLVNEVLYLNSSQIPSWIIYSLPGALWCSLLMFASKGITLPLGTTKFQLIHFPFIAFTGLEILQFFHFTDGTFDWMDVNCLVIAYTISLFLIKRFYPFPKAANTPALFVAFLIFLGTFLADLVNPHFQ